MNPEIAAKLAAMGDIKGNAEKLRVALDAAKKNPNDPRSVELRRRMERGMLNKELEALGKKPFPVQVPKIDMAKAMAGVTAAPQTKVPTAPEQTGVGPFDSGVNMAGWKERGGDIKETFLGAGGAIKEGLVNAGEIARNPELSPVQRVVGPVIAAGSGVANALGEVTIGAGKLALTQEAEDTVKNFAQSIGEKVSETEAARKTIEWYEALPPEQKANLQMFGGLANIVSTVFGFMGGKAATGAVRETAEVSIPAVRQGVDTTVDTLKQGARTTAGMTQKVFTPSAAEVTKRIDDAVGRIIQGTPDDIAAGRKALQQLDTTGIEDYASLNTRITDATRDLAKKVDVELAKYPDVIPAQEWVKTTKVGDEIVTQNPIKDALDGLENAYTLSGELPEAARVRQLRAKFESSGLTRIEANNLAREYGIEFRDRAFTKLGDPKPGFNAENFENVRVGVKRAVRDKMPDNVTRELDAQMSDLYSTKILTEKMETQVQKLYQKVKNRTLAQKVGGAVADVFDLATMGTLRGFVQKLLPSNVGLKTANSLDLQNELAKNLAQIQRLNKIKDPDAFAKAFEKYITEDINPGLSIRNTVTPAKVGAKLTESEFDMLVSGLDDIALARTQPDFNAVLTKYGLQNAKDDELVKFIRQATDEFEMPGATERPVFK
jgi:hypothetical protein